MSSAPPNPLPKEPPRELLVSMAMRLRHDFGMDRIEMFPGHYMGLSPEERREILVDMERLYEEVAGHGFYRWGDGAGQRGGMYSGVKIAQ